ncbi:MAG: nitroreductase family protein [Deltaproteobacteria bacterium]|nr:nitroreductase family protein [Candidatus Anaeroferrophillus wilburensis]MBN2888512.1 nitroreductase family protein [Deltaproteobacteria bacterium]
MDISTLQDLLRERTSCRSYVAGEAIPAAAITAIIAAGQQAPNPLNQQPWSFIVIDNAAIKKKLRQAGENAKQIVLEKGGPEWVGGFNIDFMEDAPLVIAVLVDPQKGGIGHYFNQPAGSIQAGSACIQNMLLAAAALNLGTLWFTFFNPDDVRDILQIPANLEIAGLVYIGTINGTPGRSKRHKPIIYDNQFGIQAQEADD